MKKLLIASFFTLCASLTYAGSGCGGGSCDGDKKDGKTGFSAPTTIQAGSGCGDACGGDKKDKKI